MMLQLYVACRECLADKRGVTAIEYAILAGLLAAALTGLFSTFGTNFGTVLTNVFTAAGV